MNPSGVRMYVVTSSPMDALLLALAIAPCAALLCGLCVGWVLGRRAEARAHELYVEGVQQARAHELALRKGSGGPCWVEAQIGLPLAEAPPPTQGTP